MKMTKCFSALVFAAAVHGAGLLLALAGAEPRRGGLGAVGEAFIAAAASAP